jgi:hypothetical protein
MNRLEQLLQMHQESPEDLFIIYGIGLEYSNSDLLKAKYYFDVLLTEHPNYLPVYYQAGILNIKLKNISEAELIINKGISVAVSQKNNHTKSELEFILSSLNNDQSSTEDEW